MKRIYTLLTMSALGLSAFASPQMASVNDQKAVQDVSSRVTTMSLENKQKPKHTRASETEIKTIDDLCGPWELAYNFSFFENVAAPGKMCVNLVKINDNQIGLTNCPYSDVTIVGDVDMSKGSITFSAQDVMSMQDGSVMEFVPHKGVPDGETINFEEDSSLVFKFDSTGFVPLDSNYDLTNLGGFAYLVKGNHDRGWFGLAVLDINAFAYNVFNEAEWSKLSGQATFVDNLANNFLTEEYQITSPVTVDCYVNKENSNLIALRNPYISGGWNEINAASAAGQSGEGMLLLDIQEPECVLLQMLTPSGLWINNAAPEEEPVYVEVLPYNEEASYVYNGYFVEDVIMEFLANEMELSTYDNKTGVVNIVNVWFGISSNPTAKYGFSEGQDNWLPLGYEIQLPDMSGVDEIAVGADAPVRYFNLQGVEIANPEAGAIVIKTQGGKATKMIVK